MGADRGDRSLWVWVGPISTVVIIFGGLVFFGVANGVDLGLTIPMSAVMAFFMGGLSALYMAASSGDEADSRDDGPDTRPAVPPPAPPGTVTRSAPSSRPSDNPVPAAMQTERPVEPADRTPQPVATTAE